MRGARRMIGLLIAVTGLLRAQQAPVRSGTLTKEQQQQLSRVKEYARAYVQGLPDFTCIQTTERDAEPVGLDSWPFGDKVRELVRFSAQRESYEVLTINGRTTNRDHSQLGGNVSRGEFGTLMDRLFDPESEAQFSYQRRTRLRGVQVDVFAYNVGREHGYTLYGGWPVQRYVAAWQGLVFAERATGRVLRIELTCVGIPMNFPVHRLQITVDYSSTKIGENEYMLPSSFRLEQESDRGMTRNFAKYAAYHKFEAQSVFSPLQM